MHVIITAINTLIDWVNNFKERIAALEEAVKDTGKSTTIAEEEIATLKLKLDKLSKAAAPTIATGPATVEYVPTALWHGSSSYKIDRK